MTPKNRGRSTRVHLTHAQVGRLVATYCEACRKVGHLTRAGARRARKLTPSGRHLNIYRCPCGGNFYHIGMLAESVRRGEMTRDEFYGGRDVRDRQD